MSQPPSANAKLKGWLVTGGTALVIVGAIYAFQSLNGADEPSRIGETPVLSAAGGASGHAFAAGDGGVSLRDELLRSTATEVHVKPLRHVWGVLMERGYTKGTATVVALTDGTASLYIPAGGAVTGAQAYAPSRLAALRLCDSAADALGDAVPTLEFPPPAKGRVRFYILTEDGVRLLDGPLSGGGADGGLDKLAPLKEAGDALLDALKEATTRGMIR
ncbi:MAG TPA: hypothetical protein VHJ20_05590 [Polyangia bacterium]|nr:hypothetical protein [Polyangia bacterium]